MPRPSKKTELSPEQLVRLAETQTREARKKEVGELIMRERRLAGLNREELAPLIPIHLNTLANWEKGIGDGEKHLKDISVALGKEESYLEKRLDPNLVITEMAEDIKALRKELGALSRYVHKQL